VAQPESLQNLLNAVAEGKMTPEDALQSLKSLPYESVGDFARIDHHRMLRTGFPEVIWGEGKKPEQILAIFKVMTSRYTAVMATRIEAAVYQQLQESLPDLKYYADARICAMVNNPLNHQPGRVTLFSAGTADYPVAAEAAVTAELCGFETEWISDVGVAGVHRLLAHQHRIAEAQVIIVVAGMEGALASVVAGLADCPVIAVPTSVGYGANFGGLAPLLTMINSCAPGIGVMNIDNGFGAAILAGKILRTAAKFQSSNGD
jgi:pyridinium-3,5-biscarboxylic acid mononucleotide synthase